MTERKLNQDVRLEAPVFALPGRAVDVIELAEQLDTPILMPEQHAARRLKVTMTICPMPREIRAWSSVGEAIAYLHVNGWESCLLWDPNQEQPAWLWQILLRPRNLPDPENVV